MEERHHELCWCDFLALGTAIANRLAKEHPRDFGGCRLGSVKYFTATIPFNMPKDAGGIERKNLWLDALHHHTQGRVEIIHGTFRPRKHRLYIEKQTDVMLASSLLTDAALDRAGAKPQTVAQQSPEQRSNTRPTPRRAMPPWW